MQTGARLGIKPATRLLAVHIGTQTLQLFEAGRLGRAWPVSTSRRPPSTVADSLGTPTGLHEIAARIGAGSPPGMVFQGRVPTGRHFREYPPEEQARTNFITTRILWLRGLEPGLNAGPGVDSHARYIYLHGTNHEDRIGTPASGGCVQLRNLDMLEIFETARMGDWVLIGT
jgi:hypothetical protein